MKAFLKKPTGRQTTVAASGVVAVAVLAAISFHQGMRYEKRRASIEDANSLCFHTFHALRGFQDAKHRRVAGVLLDRSMDIGALDLAGLCLRHPGRIERGHYNILVRVRDYRKTYGRDLQRTSGNDVSLGNGMEFHELDRKIDEAIALLESIHDTNNWMPSPLLQGTKQKTE